MPPGWHKWVALCGDLNDREQFNVSVQALLEANNLTAEQADSLRVGQELIIP